MSRLRQIINEAKNLIEIKEVTQRSTSTNMDLALKRLKASEPKRRVDPVFEPKEKVKTEQERIASLLNNPNTPTNVLVKIEQGLHRFATSGLRSKKKTGPAGLTPLILALKEHPNTPADIKEKYQGYQPEYLTMKPKMYGRVVGESITMSTLMKKLLEDLGLATTEERPEEIESKDPNTNDGRLKELHTQHADNPNVLKNIAENPNANFHTMMNATQRLGVKAPHLAASMFNNPTFSTGLHALEDPNFSLANPKEFWNPTNRNHEKGLRAVAKSSSLSPDLQQQIIDHSISHDITHGLAENPALHPEVANQLADVVEYHPQLKQAFANNPSIPDDVLERYKQEHLAGKPVSVLGNPRLDSDFIRTLHNKEHYQDPRPYLAHANTPPDVIHSIVGKVDPQVMAKNSVRGPFIDSVLQHPKTSEETKQLLIQKFPEAAQ